MSGLIAWSDAHNFLKSYAINSRNFRKLYRILYNLYPRQPYLCGLGFSSQVCTRIQKTVHIVQTNWTLTSIEPVCVPKLLMWKHPKCDEPFKSPIPTRCQTTNPVKVIQKLPCGPHLYITHPSQVHRSFKTNPNSLVRPSPCALLPHQT